MNVAGIIAEYNPFHNGHEYLIRKARGLGYTHIVAVMSGNFTQRGEPAVLPKQARIRAAMACGVDLCIELPAPWAVASAENFAYGAVYILDALGCIDGLCFGSECGDLARLIECAEAVTALDGSEKFKAMLRQGYSFAKARCLCLDGFSDLIGRPNNILAIEYIKALRRLQSVVKPVTVKRTGAAHDSHGAHGGFASASSIRSMWQSSGIHSPATNSIPPAALEIYRSAFAAGSAPFDRNKWEIAALSRLRALNAARFAALPDVSEGLENRIAAAVSMGRSLQEIEEGIKTRRYALSRIRRILLCACLNITKDIVLSAPPYARVMALNDRGREILHTAGQSSRIPVLSRHSGFMSASARCREIYALECHSSDLYSLCLPVPLPCSSEQKYKTYYQKTDI